MTLRYQTTFILDKAYYAECYDASIPVKTTWQAYKKATLFTLVGAILVLATDVSPYAAWFVFGLGIVEALGTYYHRPWWLARQMLSRAANNEAELTISAQQVACKSSFVNFSIEWQNVDQIEKAPNGWLLISKQGKHYLSNQHLNEEVMLFLSNLADEKAQASVLA